MGFDMGLAERALLATRNNITDATNVLLSGSVPPGPPTASTAAAAAIPFGDLVRSITDALAPSLVQSTNAEATAESNANVAGLAQQEDTQGMDTEESEEAMLMRAIAMSLQGNSSAAIEPTISSVAPERETASAATAAVSSSTPAAVDNIASLATEVQNELDSNFAALLAVLYERCVEVRQ